MCRYVRAYIYWKLVMGTRYSREGLAAVMHAGIALRDKYGTAE